MLIELSRFGAQTYVVNLTSEPVLCTLFAGRNHLLDHFHILFHHKWKKRNAKKGEKYMKKWNPKCCLTPGEKRLYQFSPHNPMETTSFSDQINKNDTSERLPKHLFAGCEPCRFSHSGAEPGAFSDRGCLLFQVGLMTGVLPGRVCLGNVVFEVS